jgi:RecJ-like exonuclease
MSGSWNPLSASSTTCPDCGRSLGSLSFCLDCLASRRRDSRRFFRSAVVLAAAVLAVVGFYAFTRDVPLVLIKDIHPGLDGARVRVQGLVTRIKPLASDERTLGFSVNDGSGELSAFVFRSEAAALERLGKLPDPGDRVDAVGRLRVRGNAVFLEVESPRRFLLAEEGSREAYIEELTPLWAGRKVRVSGEVLSADTFGEQAVFALFDPADPAAVVRVPLTAAAAAALALCAGDHVTVTGLLVAAADGLRVVPQSPGSVLRDVSHRHGSVPMEKSVLSVHPGG